MPLNVPMTLNTTVHSRALTRIAIATNAIALFGKRRRVHQMADLLLHQVHDEHGAHHASVAEGGTTIKSGETRICHDLLARFREGIVRGTLDVALHARFDGIEGMGEVAGKETTQERGGDARLVVGVEGFRVILHEPTAHDGWDGQVPARPQGFSDGAPDESTSDVGGVLHDVGEADRDAAALALLLDHDELKRAADQSADGTRADSACHFFEEAEVAAGVVTQQHAFESAADGELNHRAGTHVDAVGTDAAVHVGGVHGDGFLLLDHVLGIIEWLQNQNLNNSHRHSDGGILELVQF